MPRQLSDKHGIRRFRPLPRSPDEGGVGPVSEERHRHIGRVPPDPPHKSRGDHDYVVGGPKGQARQAADDPLGPSEAGVLGQDVVRCPVDLKDEWPPEDPRSQHMANVKHMPSDVDNVGPA